MQPDPVQDHPVGPEPMRPPAEKSEMAAFARRDQLDVWIGADCGGFEYAVWDEGVVLRLDEQRGNADPRQEMDRGLRLVVFGGAAKAERRSGDAVIEIEQSAQAGKIGSAEAAGSQEPRAHPADEAELVEPVIGLGDSARARGKVERSGDGADAADQLRAALTEFTREFQHDIPAQREPDQERDRKSTRLNSSHVAIS